MMCHYRTWYDIVRSLLYSHLWDHILLPAPGYGGAIGLLLAVIPEGESEGRVGFEGWGRERLGWEGQTYICLLTSNSKLPSCLDFTDVIDGDQWHEMRGLIKRKEMRGVEPHAWLARGECSRRMFSTLLYSSLLYSSLLFCEVWALMIRCMAYMQYWCALSAKQTLKGRFFCWSCGNEESKYVSLIRAMLLSYV